MARKKKSGSKDKPLQIIVFATAILNPVRALVDLIRRLTEQREGLRPLSQKG